VAFGVAGQLVASSDGEPQIGDLTGRRNECPLKGDRPEVRRVDEADAVSQQDRDQVDHDLVEQSGTKALQRDAGAEDDDILTRGCVGCRRHGVAQLI
jgi:hypothetical protein